MLEFSNAGFAEDDLRLMLEHIKRVNKKREFAYRLSIRFDKTVGDLERAGDLIGEARAEKRKMEFRRKQSFCEDKASVLRTTGRPDTKPLPEPQQAKQVMEGLLKKEFKDALKEAEESMRTKT